MKIIALVLFMVASIVQAEQNRTIDDQMVEIDISEENHWKKDSKNQSNTPNLNAKLKNDIIGFDFSQNTKEN